MISNEIIRVQLNLYVSSCLNVGLNIHIVLNCLHWSESSFFPALVNSLWTCVHTSLIKQRIDLLSASTALYWFNSVFASPELKVSAPWFKTTQSIFSGEYVCVCLCVCSSCYITAVSMCVWDQVSVRVCADYNINHHYQVSSHLKNNYLPHAFPHSACVRMCVCVCVCVCLSVTECSWNP